MGVEVEGGGGETKGRKKKGGRRRNVPLPFSSPLLLRGRSRRAADRRGRRLDRRLPGRGRGLTFFLFVEEEERREGEKKW